MEEKQNENSENGLPNGEPEEEKKQNRIIGFLSDILRGVAIGVAFIIPGFSGGSVAAILGIYERLVGIIDKF